MSGIHEPRKFDMTEISKTEDKKMLKKFWVHVIPRYNPNRLDRGLVLSTMAISARDAISKVRKAREYKGDYPHGTGPLDWFSIEH